MVDATAEIDWKGLDRDKFERIVEVLLRRKWEPSGATVICPDGRGGDGGVDVDVQHHDGRRTIYQLKFYPDGFSGNLKSSRQRQIAKSFVSAMKLDEPPTEWFLVVPAKLTKGEREFVLKLAEHRTLAKEGIDPPVIDIVGITELDDLSINDPGVHRYLARNQLRGDVDAYGLERATLDGGVENLHNRLADLGRLADSTDLHWGYDFARSGNITTVTVKPLHPSSALVSPIKGSLAIEFGPEHESVRKRFERSIKFGASGRVALSKEVVRRLTIDGPDLIRGAHENIAVVFEAVGYTAAVGNPVSLQFYDAEGNMHASHEGTVAFADQGSHGYALKAEFYGQLSAEFLIPADKEKKGHTDIRYSLNRLLPREVIGIIELLRLLQIGGAVCKLYINGHMAISFRVDPHSEGDSQDELVAIYEYAYDLTVIQRHLHTAFHLPNEFSVEDRIHARIARSLIDGYIVESIKAPALTAALSGEDSPEIRKRLIDPTHVEAPIDYSFTIGGRLIELGTVIVFHPNARAINGKEALLALDAGTGKGFVVRLEPLTSRYFYVCIPEKIRDPEHSMIAEWTLTGIAQPGPHEHAMASS